MRRIFGVHALLISGLASAVTALSLACGSTDSPGSVMVVLSTDFAIPKDVDQVGVFIASNGRPVFRDIEPVIGGVVRFPATIAVTHEGDDGSPTISVRAVAFSRGEVRVLRDALTTIPRTRRVTLRMPLQFLADGSGTGVSPLGGGTTSTGVADGGVSSVPEAGAVGSASVNLLADFEPFVDLVSTCAPSNGKLTTSVAGTCQPAEIDEATLPDYDERKVFGGAPAPEASDVQTPGACFDSKLCFSTALEVVPDEACTLPLPLGGTNVAVRTSGGAGECLGGACYVPLDYFEGDAAGRDAGFWVDATRAHLPPALCAKVKASGGTIGVAIGAGCNDRWKVESLPLCGVYGATDGTGPLPSEALVPENEKLAVIGIGNGPGSVVDGGAGQDSGSTPATPAIASVRDPVDLVVDVRGFFVASRSATGVPAITYNLDATGTQCTRALNGPQGDIVPSGFPSSLTVRKIAVLPPTTTTFSAVMMLGQDKDLTVTSGFSGEVDFTGPDPGVSIQDFTSIPPLIRDVGVYRSDNNIFGAWARTLDPTGDGGTDPGMYGVSFGATEVMSYLQNTPANLRSLSRRSLADGSPFGVIDVGGSPRLHILQSNGDFGPNGASHALPTSAVGTRLTVTPAGGFVVGTYESGDAFKFFRIATTLGDGGRDESAAFTIQRDADGNLRGFDADDTYVYFARQEAGALPAGIYRLPLSNLAGAAEVVAVTDAASSIGGVVVFGGVVFWTQRPLPLDASARGAIHCQRPR